MATGIYERHARACRSHSGGRCNCEPSYEAKVGGREDRQSRTFPTYTAAAAWQREVQALKREGKVTSRQTVQEAWEAWIAGARAGTIRTRSGDAYKPAAVRSYEASMRLRVLPEFGHRTLATVTREQLQQFVDLLVEGHAPTTVECTMLPLRRMYHRALTRGQVQVNPTAGLELPRARGGRDRIASPKEAAKLLAALEVGDRVIWAAAMYAGLRRGELRALRGRCVDLANGVIRVEKGWDAIEGEIETKGHNKRRVPIPTVLRDYLTEHKARNDYAPEALVFGEAGRPFRGETLLTRAYTRWKDAGLDRITLHECRHTYASLMIAAGTNAKALSTYMGHASVAFTYDRYGHLMPGNEDQAASLLDAYLERETTAV
ncbi:MAG: site-specific integrase [Thermoleophilaceae bacterium]|nr:site-specific integrase [Thermoleophilaceae bacterium]